MQARRKFGPLLAVLVLARALGPILMRSGPVPRWPLLHRSDSEQAVDTRLDHITENGIATMRLPENELDRPARGIFEAPSGLVWSAIARNKLIVFVCAIALASAGVLYGAARHPTYEASTTLQVGTVNLNSPGFYGFVQAASSLATVFSRTITAGPVLEDLQAKLGVTPSQAARRLAAEPIPISPSFRIVATGDSASSAIALANTTAAAVISYERHAAEGTSPQTAALLKEYSKAAEQLEQATAAVEGLRAQLAREKTNRGAAARFGAALLRARVAQSDARTRANALEASYRNVTVANAGANPAGGLVSLVAAASTATNDHSSKIKLYGLVGLLAGLTLGCILAIVRERVRSARRGAVGDSGMRTSEQPA
jgi:capsular polysaccharide biosynthesis protein